MKKADYILIVLTIITAVIVFAYNSYSVANQGNTEKYVIVYVDGYITGKYDISENRVLEISESGYYNKIVIEDRWVWMEKADCHDQICVKTKKISNAGESIVCLPHRVLVTIESDGENTDDGDDVDVISQ